MAKRKEKKPSKLKAMITKRGMTLLELQETIEKNSKDDYTIDIHRLSRYSNIGKGLNAHLQIMVRIAKALNCSLDEIVDEM